MGAAILNRRSLQRAASICVIVVVGIAAGCAEDTPEAEEEPAYVISVTPAAGRVICEGGEVVLTFNRDPGEVRSAEGWLGPAVQTGSDRVFRATVHTTMTFDWDRGAMSVEYQLVTCEAGGVLLVGVTPDQGHVAVHDLETTGIVLEFSEPAFAAGGDWTQSFEITRPDGWEWDAPVTADGNRVTLGPPEPGVFVAGERYDIRGVVADRGGYETAIHLVYITVDSAEQGVVQ